MAESVALQTETSRSRLRQTGRTWENQPLPGRGVLRTAVMTGSSLLDRKKIEITVQKLMRNLVGKISILFHDSQLCWSRNLTYRN